MNLLALVKLAAKRYVDLAYPDGTPGSPSKMLIALDDMVDETTLLTWEALEREEERYSLRLGNHAYPHMKLVFSLENNHPTFYVDAHDDHFDLPPGVPGYEKLLEMRASNKKLKQKIEGDWAREHVPIFAVRSIRATINTKIDKELAGLRVLAVDDEIQILDMLKLIVGALGAELHGAKSALEARRLIEAHGAPDLVFCDIMMPEESGYDFVAWLRENELRVPVIFITGYALDQVVKGDTSEVLQKPFTAKAIMKIMKRVRAQIDTEAV